MNRILVIICIIISINAGAQEVYNSSGRSNARSNQKKETGFNPDNLIYGGGIGLQFGNPVTSIGVSPIIGYRFSDRFAAGIGLGYAYFRWKDAYSVFDTATGNFGYKHLNAHSFSGSVWARYLVFDNIFVHAEPEYYMQTFKEYPTVGAPRKITESAPALLVGVGYRFPVSERASMVGMVMYDVVQDKFSPYGPGIFTRFGFNIGF
ncbi:MAG: hypothetical protein EOP49_04830 [Sphingobacteriales bacterium]|nr:MAG: hypothetical protein EOP49_04830 [Sphingobacteriales bacterium]